MNGSGKALVTAGLCSLLLAGGVTLAPTITGTPQSASGERTEPLYDRPATTSDDPLADETIDDEAAPLDDAPPVEQSGETAAPASFDVTTSAPGTRVESNGAATIDYSNASSGYVMVRLDEDSGRRLKAIVKGPVTPYQYDIRPLTWTALPLSEGNGFYSVTLYENVGGTRYRKLDAVTFGVTMGDGFGPFLRSNIYVDVEHAPRTMAKAAELCAGATDSMDKVTRIYDWVVANVSYDGGKATTVQTGYAPVLDSVLESGTGICIDYAALMAGMLRSQGVPCRLVVGFAGDVYHAWIDVFADEGGWVSGAVWHDGSSWRRMDPTFASGANGDEAILDYIGNGENYTARYYY